MNSDYLEALGCIFLPEPEFSFIESELPNLDRAGLAIKDLRVELEDGMSYKYMPIEINGKKYKAIRGTRPPMPPDLREEWSYPDGVDVL